MRGAVRHALGGVGTPVGERKIETRVGERMIETQMVNVDFHIGVRRFTERTRGKGRAMEITVKAKQIETLVGAITIERRVLNV